ncbi:hypothetical protein [Candidatus Vondammii sp. HM_W22]|uniref:hypothetical protein n=1 Tax=Candidatus Vondammii sp. HM_W22 TaxID=2687299 RepID=UPI001F12919B|nr:hypothetical protein [Candidatus Vondammii sp. HM_W22]
MRALDFAHGRGVSALALAGRELPLGISICGNQTTQSTADDARLSIHAEVKDVVTKPS